MINLLLEAPETARLALKDYVVSFGLAHRGIEDWRWTIRKLMILIKRTPS